ncbi:hypothetical protein N657DRAFT_636746 [Parathielavia appendiculata]|uniref:Uncharacterized protein n=1 Tax=Parathielavia appendiculata TaxID=2587402 RepID=A0AAN6TT81_9PEZI|nr:hypothetical protein N657DRAFT_636746 [Parathielavia appendiculata]
MTVPNLIEQRPYNSTWAGCGCARVRKPWITSALFEGSYDLPIERYLPRCYRISRPWSYKINRGTSVTPDFKEGQAYYAAYRAAVADHLSIATTPVLRRALEHAFERLPDLKSVGLRHCKAYRVPVRNGEIIWARPDVKCKGWKALAEAAGHDPAEAWYDALPMSPGTPRVRAHVVSTLLMALVTARKKIDILTSWTPVTTSAVVSYSVILDSPTRNGDSILYSLAGVRDLPPSLHP